MREFGFPKLNILFFLIVFFSTVAAASAQVGNISGTVTDVSERGVLVGAQVQVEGQNRSATTNDSGKYLILGAPAGKARITVSYLGLDPSTKKVSVSAGSTALQDFSLSLPVASSEVSVVSSSLAGQERALND